MRHEYEKTRRHAENTLAEVNRHLDKGNIRNPRHHQMLTDMAEKATRTLNNLDTMDDAKPYSDTNIGYNTDIRRRKTHGDMATNTHNIHPSTPVMAHNDAKYDARDDTASDREHRPGPGMRR